MSITSKTVTAKTFYVPGQLVINFLGLEAGDQVVAAEWGINPEIGQIALIIHVKNEN